MSATLSADLLEQMRDADRNEPKREIAIIVNLTPGTDPMTLSAQGLTIAHVFDAISSVSGTATAADVRRLATLASVVSIDFDSPAHALKPPTN